MALKSQIESLATRVGTEFKTLRTQLTGNSSGTLSGLTTDAKTSLIAAINEVDAAVTALASAEGGATIADGVPASTSVWSSAKTDAEINSSVAEALASLVDSAPGVLNTLNELAAALGDDPAFATTITSQLAGKAAAVHSHTTSQITDFATAVDGRVPGAVPVASATVQGKVELATDVEALAGTDIARAVTPAALAAVVAPITTQLSGKAATSHTHTASQISDFATAVDGRVPGAVPAASLTAQGKIELATDAEAIAGTDAIRAVTPAALMAVVGSSTANFVATFEAGLV